MKKLFWLLVAVLVFSTALAQQTRLRVFVGGQQRPDVMRKIFDLYQSRNPGVRVDLEVGGATSDQQQQYLTTVLASRDPSIDVILIDVIRPAQYLASRWADTLDKYLPAASRQNLLRQYLPAYSQANVINGQLVALPAFADAMFLYYRADLLEKYNFKPPTTWDEAIQQAQTILQRENNPNLNGIGYIGAPIEGTVCTFLLPIWAAGGDVTNAQGQFSLTVEQAQRSLQFWVSLMDRRVSPPNMAEKPQDTIRQEMQAGRWIFGTLFAYAWNRFQNDPDSQVKGKIGVVPLPAFPGGRQASCLGGWQWTVSDFSRNKAQAHRLVRFLSSPEVSKILAIDASNLPVFPSLYRDADILRVNPWFAQALPVVQAARARPQHPRYAEISEAIRVNTNQVLARQKTPEQGARDIVNRLQAIYSGR
ncbi:ABC transporter substrate-binding protein [Meiothermus ruber]|mgnify:CR=1 FL=1|jgi:multiple sugar transport system substrate-binding protein|uniref:Extracellular solute-binding protein n=1 Tax=Meiothermus ruber (strain ATCC 35948 / DSM 1279 / VKM B-1258 / 21) TaxID=504728 RepID=D3PMA4_MEIRD|nr:ABC transporter substrate-binding protein [Meiothermus ruber]ADD29210.1 extracellular solute-binding protein family 1 [Meiothermus ruber DSM 1279]AGK05339.1 extracellular solute-binding protein [Meiothermus ruber DSM 1279]MCL6531512.1 ABC transporter substrate-binding protein [Meiothermus ruber]